MSNTLITARLALGLLALSGLGASAQTACQSMAGIQIPGLRLSAELVAGGASRPAGATRDETLIEHCKLNASMAERRGIDGRNYAIGFELRLPVSQWNHRFLFQGGGGNDGVVRPAVGPQATPAYALNRGFAVVTTDAGHQGTDATFGHDPQARVDHAYSSYDQVATIAKQLVARFYAAPPDKSYFVGCSGGGRQAMVFSQKFPAQFDGIVAMAPAMRVAKEASIAAAWDSQALLAVAPGGADGKPVLSQALSDGDLQLLRKGILDACDAQDGLVDGLVSHPAACKFNPEVLKCTAGKTASCLSAGQVGALNRVFEGARNAAGQPLYFPWPWDAGVGHPANDWRMWKLGNSTTATPNSRHVFLMADAIRHEFFTPPQPDFDIFRFNFERDPARMDAYAWMYDTADDATLKDYKARGGKLLIAHGLADPIFSPNESIDYYRRLSATHGKGTSDFARLFLIPGMGHCQGGAATDVWDGLGAMVDWVEKSTPPQRIVASGSSVFPGRTRPLCAWPAHAQYNGQGDPQDAANFRCE